MLRDGDRELGAERDEDERSAIEGCDQLGVP